MRHHEKAVVIPVREDFFIWEDILILLISLKQKKTQCIGYDLIRKWGIIKNILNLITNISVKYTNIILNSQTLGIFSLKSQRRVSESADKPLE